MPATAALGLLNGQRWKDSLLWSDYDLHVTSINE
jgi:hypothetical protein